VPGNIPAHYKSISRFTNKEVKDFGNDKKEQQLKQFLDNNNQTIFVAQGTGIALTKDQAKMLTNLASAFPEYGFLVSTGKG